MNNTKKIKYDKRYESDGQMLIRISKKFAVLFVVIFMFDTIFELLHNVFDVTLTVLHTILDFFEYSLELLLEHLLNANHQQSDMIIVNFTIVFGIYLFYRFCLVLPRFTNWVKRRIKAAWLRRKRREIHCWHALPFNRKIKVCIVYLTGISCILFLVTL